MKAAVFKWNYELEEKLELAVHTFGRNWIKIQKFCFPELKPEQIKNKWYQLVLVGRVSTVPKTKCENEEEREGAQKAEMLKLIEELGELL